MKVIPFSRRMKRAFVYVADGNNQFEEIMGIFKKNIDF